MLYCIFYTLTVLFCITLIIVMHVSFFKQLIYNFIPNGTCIMIATILYAVIVVISLMMLLKVCITVLSNVFTRWNKLWAQRKFNCMRLEHFASVTIQQLHPLLASHLYPHHLYYTGNFTLTVPVQYYYHTDLSHMLFL